MTRLNRITLTTIFIFALFTIAPSTLAGGAVPRWFQPIMNLPKSTIPTWICVMRVESRSTFLHPNLGDNNRYGSSGIFQMEDTTFRAYERAAHVPFSVHVWQASPFQQASVASAIYRADGFGPWTRYDGC